MLYHLSNLRTKSRQIQSISWKPQSWRMGKATLTLMFYQKPTDIHPYLHWTSAHPPHLKSSIPYSQALRLRQICSSTDTLRKRIIEYSDFFVACGYERGKVLNEMQRVLTLTQEKSLQTKERQPMDWIHLVTTYNPHATFIAEVAKRNWNFFNQKND